MIEIAIKFGYFSTGFLCGALFFVAVYYKRLVALSWQVHNDIKTVHRVRREVDAKLAEMEGKITHMLNLARKLDAHKKTSN